MNVVTYEPARGPDIAQGDLLLTDLRHPVFGRRWTRRLPEGPAMRPEDGVVRLLAGEVSGHHHDVVIGSRGIARFRDDGLARPQVSPVPATVPCGTARLVWDEALLEELVGTPHWTREALRLAIGFLVVEGGAVDLVHPEHDTWRLPESLYYCGRQMEFVSSGAEWRTVED